MAKLVSTGQISIVDFNDVTISSSAPATPVLNQLWFDTSPLTDTPSGPAVMKMWNGTSWSPGNITAQEYQDLLNTIAGTEEFITPGPPTNTPVPTGVTFNLNSNGSSDAIISWDTYVQGELKADNILVVWTKGASALTGRPTLLDSVEITNVNTDNPSYFTLAGINPEDHYSFGLAASRRTKNGIEYTDVISVDGVTATFTRSSNATKLDGSSVNANEERYEVGKVGNAIMLEESTTNNLSSVASRMTGGWVSQYSSNDASKSGIALNSGGEEKAVMNIISAITSWTDIRYNLTSAASYSGQTWTLSFGELTVTGLTSGGFALQIEDYDGTTYRSSSTNITANGTYTDKSVTRTFTNPITSGWVGIRALAGTNAGATITIKRAQLENKLYATSWIDGTRPSEVLSIPSSMVPLSEGSICGWMKKRASYNSAFGYNLFAHRSAPYKDYIIVQKAAGGSWRLLMTSNAQTDGTAGANRKEFYVTDNTAANSWVHFAVRWSSSEAAMFINGNKIGTIANPPIPTVSAPQAYIGSWGYDTGAYPIGGLLDSFLMFDKSLSDSEILELYNKVDPQLDGNTLLKLDFNNSLTQIDMQDIVGGSANYTGDIDGIPATGIGGWADVSTGTTKIKGGAILADSISATSLNIGSRSCSFDGIAFQLDKNTNIVSWTSGNITWIDDTGAAVVTAVASGTNTCNTSGTTYYFYWVKNASSVSVTTSRSTAFQSLNLVIGTYFKDTQYLNINYGKTIVDGSEITAGTIKADRLAANTITAGQLASSNLITLAAQIGDAVITTAHVSTLDISSAKITGDLSAARMQVNAGNAINSGTVKVDPGKILISGSTTLADWRHGTDTTKIDGGDIFANSITANKINIGLRGITIEGIELSSNYPVLNTLYWSSGNITYIDDNGSIVSSAISSGNILWTTGVVYLYWTQGASGLSTTTTASTANASNAVLIATYRGSVDLVANYGRTIIDGSKITTGTIVASTIKAGTLTSASGIFGTLSGDDITFTNLKGSSIKTGSIKSTNYSATVGSSFDLDTGILTIGGSGSPKFTVNASGQLTATNATIAGSISAGNSITVGGVTINAGTGTNNGSISLGKSTFADTNAGFWLGNNAGTPSFKLYKDASNYLSYDTNSGLSLRGTLTADDIKAGTLDASAITISKVKSTFDAGVTYDFTNTVDGWTTSGSTLVAGATSATLNASYYAKMTRTGIVVDPKYKMVRVRMRRVSGTEVPLLEMVVNSLYSYYPQVSWKYAVGEWGIVDFDMTTAIPSTSISSIQLSFYISSGSLEIDYIQIGNRTDSNINQMLTLIDQNGIYTGSLTADQITAGTISSSLIAAGSITADKLTIAAGGPLMSETFDTSASLSRWTNKSGSGEVTWVATGGPDGGPYISIGNNAGTDDMAWYVYNQDIPFDPDKLYRIRCKARRTAGNGNIYFGWIGVQADGQIVSSTGTVAAGNTIVGSSHYHASYAAPVGATWKEYVGYTKGWGNPSGTVGWSGGGCPITSPGKMYSSVRYLRPLIVVNHPSLIGTTDIESFIVDVIPANQARIDENGVYVGAGSIIAPPVTWNITSTTISQNAPASFKKINATVNNWGDAQVYSTEGYKTCYVTFTAAALNCGVLVGLNTDPTTDANYTSIDYAWYPTTYGTAYIEESGTANPGSYIPVAYNTNTVFTITYDGVHIKYYQDGAYKRSVYDPGKTFYFDSSFYTTNAAIANVKFGEGVPSQTFITSGGIFTGTITADQIVAGTISGDRISGGTITGTTISGNTITGGTISGTTITGSTISGATLETSSSANVGVKITSNGLTAFNASGRTVLNILTGGTGRGFLGNIEMNIFDDTTNYLAQTATNGTLVCKLIGPAGYTPGVDQQIGVYVANTTTSIGQNGVVWKTQWYKLSMTAVGSIIQQGS